MNDLFNVVPIRQAVGTTAHLLMASVASFSSIAESSVIDYDDFANSGSFSEFSFPAALADAPDAQNFRTIVPYKETWGKRDQRRFKELAIKRALQQINSTEQTEFSSLQAARRRFESPLTNEQILADLKREEMLDDLLKFFEKHAVASPSHF